MCDFLCGFWNNRSKKTDKSHLTGEAKVPTKLLDIDILPSYLRQTIAMRELSEEQKLFWQGDSAQAVFIVKTGRLKVVRYKSCGTIVRLCTATAGDILAETTLFSSRYTNTAIAETASQVMVYPKKHFLAALHSYPDLAEDFMAILVKKNQCLQHHLELRDIKTAHERVLQYLSQIARLSNQASVNLDRPLKEIAAELGLTPETLSRALKRLERDGLISRSQRAIALH
ncbi:Crp/Fnr family transcriptional regulator [Okeania sp. SIO2C9]|uniref:Crp/Fnr family transcriptional regulator n=1 Tax=Okeania sp. SIO2C9 TaxID=2607791 RepID=UPI0025D4412E|nr:Crp/Fnr family transcriptional regulator [Okeania sp. SIO2C9]